MPLRCSCCVLVTAALNLLTMSYDYSLFKPLGTGPMSSWPAELPAALGSADEVKQALSKVFPNTDWELFEDSWFGRWENGKAHAEFQFTSESDEMVHFLTMRRAERSEVEKLCGHLDVIALDTQKMEQYSNLTPRWSRAE